MVVLVDYDNIEPDEQKKGLQYIVDKIAACIAPENLVETRRLLIRLYGGWYSNTSITSKAQDLQIEIDSKFPTTSILSDGETSIMVQCEIAYSTLVEPKFHLFHTFREKSITNSIYAKTPLEINCLESNCILAIINEFINNKRCPKCGSVKIKDVLYKKEQKLVDSMIITDLLNESSLASCIGLLSSDDDCWPGIRASLNLNNQCLLIHMKSKDSLSSSIYTKNIGTNYKYVKF